MALVPQLVGRVGCVVDLSAAFRLKDATLLPAVVRLRPRPARAAGRGRLRPARASPRGAQGRPLIATPGCYVTAATLALAPLLDAGLIEPTGHHRRRRQRRVRRRARRRRRPTRSAPSTRTSSPTACSTTATPRRSSRTSAPRCCSRRTSAPMNRGILATCYARPGRRRRAVDRGRCSTRCARPTPASRSSSSRRLAVDEGHARLQQPPTSPPATTSAPATSSRSARSTTSPRAPPAARCRRPTSPSASPETAGLPLVGAGAVRTIDREHVDRTVAHVLVEALPYIRRFAGKTWSSSTAATRWPATSDHDALALFAEDIVLMRLVGMRPVVVHGGGPQISELMARLGKTTEFRDGLRVTDAETVDIARMVLIGQVNPQLVAAINLHGHYAVGVCGEDAGLIRRRPRDPELGFVGDVDADQPGDPRGPAGRRVHPGRRHDRHRRHGARPTTSTPTPWPARSPRRSTPRSSST